MNNKLHLEGIMHGGVAKVKTVTNLFITGFKTEAGSDWNIGISTVSGLWCGLKYKGSIAQGLRAGLTTYITLNAVNGLSCVINNWDKVKRSV